MGAQDFKTSSNAEEDRRLVLRGARLGFLKGSKSESLTKQAFPDPMKLSINESFLDWAISGGGINPGRIAFGFK